MFGDDPNPTVTTARVGSGTASRCAHEEVRGVTRELRLGLVVGREWVGLRGEKRRGPTQSSETENVRRMTGYNAAIVIRWGVKRTPNAMKLGRRPTYNITTPHAHLQSIPRTFSGRL